MVEDHLVEDTTDHDEIGLQRFDFDFFEEDEKGVGREGSIEFPYLLILIKLWSRNWNTQLKRINQKVDEENGKS